MPMSTTILIALLDLMMPSRLFCAFPEGITPRRGLKQVVEGVREYPEAQP